MKRAVIVGLVALAIGCTAAAFQSRDVELDKAGQKTRIRDDTGAIIVGKRQVGAVRDGKIVNSRGQPLAFVYPDRVQLKGGAEVAIKVDAEGTMYLSEAEQTAAGLAPMSSRIRADGRVSSTAGAEGVPSTGTRSADKRRLLLVVLLLTANSLW